EIKAAGKLQLLTVVRRRVLWASAAAAGLFILVNVLYFTANRPAPTASQPMAPAVAKSAPPVSATADANVQMERRAAPEGKEADRAGNEENALRRTEAARKAPEAENKFAETRKLEEAERGKLADAAKKPAEAPAPPPPAPT